VARSAPENSTESHERKRGEACRSACADGTDDTIPVVRLIICPEKAGTRINTFHGRKVKVPLLAPFPPPVRHLFAGAGRNPASKSLAES
jgi:hypothetical protein